MSFRVMFRVGLTNMEMKPYEACLERSETLPKYDILIKPQSPNRG